MTTKKLVSELSREELKEVFNANQKLQVDVLEDMQENEIHWINEHMENLEKSIRRYEISPYAKSYISVYDELEKLSQFVDGALQNQKDFCVLADEETPKIEKLAAKFETLFDMEWENKQYENLEKWLEKEVDELAEKIANYYDSVFRSLYDEENQLDYFIEFYAAERLDQQNYILVEDGNFVLYEDISYTKSYN